MRYEITGGSVEINKYDLPLISGTSWHIAGDGYAQHTVDGGKKIYMHDVLIGKAPKGLVTDHKNRNKLDNRRRNLRHITRSENIKNSDWYESGALHEHSRTRLNEYWALIKAHGLTHLSQLDQCWKVEAMQV